MQDPAIGRKVDELFRTEYRLPIFFHVCHWLELDMPTLRYFCRACRHLPNPPPEDPFASGGLNIDKTQHVNLLMHEQTISHCMVRIHSCTNRQYHIAWCVSTPARTHNSM